MGAGCYYTHKTTGTKAYWLDLDYIHEEENQEHAEMLWEDVCYEIQTLMEGLGYTKYSNYEYRNGLYVVYFESTYYGDGMVIRIEPVDTYDHKIYNLAMANHAKAEHKIAKAFNKYYNLCTATSGYSCQKIKVNEL